MILSAVDKHLATSFVCHLMNYILHIYCTHLMNYIHYGPTVCLTPCQRVFLLGFASSWCQFDEINVAH